MADKGEDKGTAKPDAQEPAKKESLDIISLLFDLIEGPSEKRRQILGDALGVIAGASLIGAAISAIAAVGEISSVGFVQAFKLYGWWWLWIPLGCASVAPAVWLLHFVMEVAIFGIYLPFSFLNDGQRALLSKIVKVVFFTGTAAFIGWIAFAGGGEHARRAVKPAAVQVVKDAAESQRKTTEAIHQTLATDQPDVAQLRVQVAQLLEEQKASRTIIASMAKDCSAGWSGSFMDKFLWPLLLVFATVQVNASRKKKRKLTHPG